MLFYTTSYYKATRLGNNEEKLQHSFEVDVNKVFVRATYDLISTTQRTSSVRLLFPLEDMLTIMNIPPSLGCMNIVNIFILWHTICIVGT